MSTSLPPFAGQTEHLSIVRSSGPGGRIVSLFMNAIPALGVVLAFFGASLGFGLSLGEQALAYTQEGGVIETLTVLFYAVVVVSGIVLLVRGQRAAGLVALLALLMGLREMDAHKAFTTYGVFKTRLYVSPDVPLAEKLIAGAVVLTLIVLVVMAIRASWRSLTTHHSKAGATLLGLGGFGLFLKEVDGLPRVLRKAGMEMDPQLLAVSKAVEEVGEMGLPVLLGLALLQIYRSAENGFGKKYTRS